MIIIQIILTFFVFFVVWSIILKYRKKEITAKEFVFWLFFWALTLVAVSYPKITDKMAKLVGVSRGADLLVYFSIFILFFVVFKIFVKLEKMEMNITKIVRKISLNEKDSKTENQNFK